jgi:hypothetical protein
MKSLRETREAAEDSVRSYAEFVGTEVTAVSEPVHMGGKVTVHAQTADGRTLEAEIRTEDLGGKVRWR